MFQIDGADDNQSFYCRQLAKRVQFIVVLCNLRDQITACLRSLTIFNAHANALALALHPA